MKLHTKIMEWKKLSVQKKNALFSRSQIEINNKTSKVKLIIEDVKAEGDVALIKYNKKFNKLDVPASKLRVKENEIAQAENSLSTEVKTALKKAYRNVYNYHRLFAQQSNLPYTEVAQGIYIAQKITPIESVGMYVPNGKGKFPSMVYMLAIPALIAKVPRKVMVSPPDESGNVDPACLYAAKLCKIDEIYKIGGAHAIAALAFGTNTIASVAKIIGPGSTFVSAAKHYVSSYVDTGLPAGPSESVIIADGSTPAELAAYDLCIEAEHGDDSMAILLTHRKDYAQNVLQHLNKIITEAPPLQQKILNTVFSKYVPIILTKSEQESIDISNKIAPEHLMIHSNTVTNFLSQINNAGEILLGEHTPFSLANYATGANAVLPTGGMAKTYSGVSVSDFTKKSSVVKVSKNGLDNLSAHVQTLAAYEGFYFHEKALAVRAKKDLKKSVTGN